LVVIPQWMRKPDSDYSQVNMGIQLIAISPRECTSCPKAYKPSDTQLDSQNQNVLLSYLDQLGQFQVYQDSQGNATFEHPNNPNAGTLGDPLGTFSELGYIEPAHQLVIDNFSMGVDDLRMSKTSIQINNCGSDDIEYNYENTQGKSSEILVKCNSCF